MKIVSWNVNSLKARLPHVLTWLTEHRPDVVFLQEIKGTELPHADLQAAGYHVHAVLQKTYNGVATLAREETAVVADKLPGDDADDQARFLDVSYKGLRLINIYAPNGNPVGTDKFTYKLNWLNRLRSYLADLREQKIPTLIAGDFNVIPEDIDAARPKDWDQDALFQPASRAAYRGLLHLGFTDAFRALHPGPGHYTFWDYQNNAWTRNAGIRIDHILLSPRLADRLVSCSIDKGPRGLEKPSDHVPIVVEIEA